MPPLKMNKGKRGWLQTSLRIALDRVSGRNPKETDPAAPWSCSDAVPQLHGLKALAEGFSAKSIPEARTRSGTSGLDHDQRAKDQEIN